MQIFVIILFCIHNFFDFDKRKMVFFGQPGTIDPKPVGYNEYKYIELYIHNVDMYCTCTHLCIYFVPIFFNNIQTQYLANHYWHPAKQKVPGKFSTLICWGGVGTQKDATLLPVFFFLMMARIRLTPQHGHNKSTHLIIDFFFFRLNENYSLLTIIGVIIFQVML